MSKSRAGSLLAPLVAYFCNLPSTLEYWDLHPGENTGTSNNRETEEVKSNPRAIFL